MRGKRFPIPARERAVSAFLAPGGEGAYASIRGDFADRLASAYRGKRFPVTELHSQTRES